MRKISSKMLLPIILLSFALASCNGGSSDSVSDSSDNSVDPETTYTVSFDLNYSGAPAAPASQTIQVNGLVAEPAAPTRDGYDFTFWATDLYGADEWDFATEVVTEDMTLYAGWSVGEETQNRIFYVSLPTWWTADNGTVSIYMWKGAQSVVWPGSKMNLVSGSVYNYTIPEPYDEFMFARINPNAPEPLGETAYWGAKTIDLSIELSGSNNLFTIQNTPAWESQSQIADGTWSVYSAQLAFIFSIEKEYIYV